MWGKLEKDRIKYRTIDLLKRSKHYDQSDYRKGWSLLEYYKYQLIQI